MKDPNNPCIFCKIRKEELQFENQLAYSSTDSYPVSQFHSLIVPKRHVETYFELSKDEIQACNELILKTKERILKQLQDLMLALTLAKMQDNQSCIAIFI